MRAFAPIFTASCAAGADLGILDCATFDAAFAGALRRRVARPLRDRGIVIPDSDLAAVPSCCP